MGHSVCGLSNQIRSIEILEIEFFEKPEIFLQNPFSKDSSWHVMYENDSKNFQKYEFST